MQVMSMELLCKVSMTLSKVEVQSLGLTMLLSHGPAIKKTITRFLALQRTHGAHSLAH